MIYDAAVVGAGPAGSSAANILEKEGFSILLVDKKAFPREKPCAGVLPPRIFSEIDIPEEVIERPLRGYRIHSPSGAVVETVFPKTGAIVRREKLDNYLVRRMDTEPVRVNVTGCKVQGDFVEVLGVDFSARARVVIGADGVNSRVRRSCFNEDDLVNGTRDLALAVQYEISLGEEDIDETIGNWFEVYYTVPCGYGWISPLKNALKVGVGSLDAEFKSNPRAFLDGFLKQENIKEKIARGHIVKTESHFIPMRGPLNLLARDRVLLAGDAGGFVFPGTGEGVYYAVKSGRIAAGIVREALGEGKGDAGSLGTAYPEELKRCGLLSLREVDFVERVLSDSEKVENYVKRLKRMMRS